MAKLFIVATPIGNLKDISSRALETLNGVDFILCEDTRTTSRLLSHYQISKPLISYHQHSKLNKTGYILELLSQGKNLALVSDAGTPGISDPGNKLVEEIANKNPSVEIIGIPGPSAVALAASVSGFPTDKFIFMGFPPMKKGRSKFFTEIAEAKYTVIFYESVHRIIKALNELSCVLPDADIVVCREMTKKFETIYRGKPSDIAGKITGEQLKGEFVVVVRRNLTQIIDNI